MDDQYPRAQVREIDGQLVLDDPDALAMIRAVEKHNCKNTLELNADRVGHFVRRMSELKKNAADTVIVLLAVDDPNGKELAEVLMPGHDWQGYRDRGEIPFARGMAGREGIQMALDIIDKEAAEKLRAAAGIAVVVVDHGVAEVFEL